MRLGRLIAAILALLCVEVSAFTTTPILGLQKPDPGDVGWQAMFNSNFNILDNAAIANGTGINGRFAVFSNNHVIGPSSVAAANLVDMTSTQSITGIKTFTSPILNTPTIDAPIITTKLRYPTVTAFPVSPTTNDTVIVSDDSAPGACDSAGGSGVTLCRYNGSSWASVSGTGSTPPFADNLSLLKDNADATRQARFELGGITPGNTRVFTVPDVDGTLTLLTATQTFQNKTIDTASNTFKVAGTTITAISGNQAKLASVFGSVTPGHLAGWDSNSNLQDIPITATSQQGNGTKVMSGTGTFTLNHTVKIDSGGALIDAGVTPSGFTIQDEGVDIATEPKLDFTGSTINCTNSNPGIKNTCTVTAAGLSANIFTDTQTLDNQKALRFRELTTNGTNYVGLQAPATLSADLTYTLPATAPTDGQVLSSLATGVMSWTTAGGGFSIPMSTFGTIPNTANTFGIDLEVITSTGTANNLKGMSLLFDGAGTGAWSSGLTVENDNLNTGTNLGLSGGYPLGTVGIQGAAFSAAAGNSVGVDGEASSSNAYNVGTYGFAQGGLEPGTNTGTAIGVLGAATGSDEASNFKNVAGLFSIYTAPITGKNLSAAIVAIGSGSDPIAVFYDGSVEKVRINDGGSLQLKGQNEIRFYDSDSSNYLSFQAPSVISADFTLAWPATDSTGTQCLSSDGAGTLGWLTCTGISATKTVRDAAGTGTCTLIFANGLLTGGSC